MATLSVSREGEKRVKGLGFLSNKGTDNFSGRIITVNGKITAEQQRVIAEAAERFGNGTITFTTRLTVEVPGIPFDQIDAFCEFIGKAGLYTGGTGAKIRPVVSCKGTTCQYGLIDTFALSEEIHQRFYLGFREMKLPHKFKIAVGGCPNNCVKPDLNDLGIIGQMIPHFQEDECRGCKKCSMEEACPIHACELRDGVLKIDEKQCNHCGRCQGKCRFHANKEGTLGYKIYIGGRWGKKVRRGIPLTRIFASREEVLEAVEKAILLYRDQGLAGERFGDMVERLGFEAVEKQLSEEKK